MREPALKVGNLMAHARGPQFYVGQGLLAVGMLNFEGLSELAKVMEVLVDDEFDRIRSLLLAILLIQVLLLEIVERFADQLIVEEQAA